MISITLYGDPIPWKRPQFKRIKNRLLSYDGQKVSKEQCKWQIKAQFNQELIFSSVLIDILFFLKIPVSTSSIKRRQMLHGKIHHIKKPDIDNLQKFVLDCLTKTVINDDSQIIQLRSKKLYSDNPCTLIRISPFELENFDENFERSG